MNLKLVREILTPAMSGGRLFIDQRFYCFTCEDTDRRLEEGNRKIPGETAIPRGKYRVVISFSHRFQKPLPELLQVTGFTGVRIHGGNGPDDTEGCVLVGRLRTANGIAGCKDVLASLIAQIEAADERGEQTWIEVV